MRRTLRPVMAGLVLLAPLLAAAPAEAAPADTYFLVAIVSDGAPPRAGSPVSFSATLRTSDNAPLAGATAQLLTRVVGSGDPFKPVATVVTDGDGEARAAVELTRNTAYRWHYAGDGAHEPASTSSLVQIVASKVVPHLSDNTPRVGQTFAATGRAYPNKAGNRVSLWSGSYCNGFCPRPYAKMIAVGRVRADGTFRLTAKLSSPGSRTLFVRVADDRENTDGYSNLLRLTVH